VAWAWGGNWGARSCCHRPQPAQGAWCGAAAVLGRLAWGLLGLRPVLLLPQPHDIAWVHGYTRICNMILTSHGRNHTGDSASPQCCTTHPRPCCALCSSPSSGLPFSSSPHSGPRHTGGSHSLPCVGAASRLQSQSHSQVARTPRTVAKQQRCFPWMEAPALVLVVCASLPPHPLAPQFLNQPPTQPGWPPSTQVCSQHVARLHGAGLLRAVRVLRGRPWVRHASCRERGAREVRGHHRWGEADSPNFAARRTDHLTPPCWHWMDLYFLSYLPASRDGGGVPARAEGRC